ncbi:hypothetical protein L210DRAFT_3454998, partial [Boletus edulis BED1]
SSQPIRLHRTLLPWYFTHLCTRVTCTCQVSCKLVLFVEGRLEGSEKYDPDDRTDSVPPSFVRLYLCNDPTPSNNLVGQLGTLVDSYSISPTRGGTHAEKAVVCTAESQPASIIGPGLVQTCECS